MFNAGRKMQDASRKKLDITRSIEEARRTKQGTGTERQAKE